MHQPTTAITALALTLTGLASPEAVASVSRTPVRIVNVSGRSGFDWGVAGIGAAAGAGITLLGIGGALTLSQRHTHPIRGPRRMRAGRGLPRRASQPTQERRDVR